VRKICLGFDKLDFGAVCQLWTVFEAYVGKGVVRWTDRRGNRRGGRRNRRGRDDDASHCCDEGKYDGECKNDNDPSSSIHLQSSFIPTLTSENYDWPPSSDQIDRAVLRKASILPVLVGRVPLRNKWSSSISQNKKHQQKPQPQQQQQYSGSITQHYLSYLTLVHSGSNERSASIESIHRYFDYAAIRGRRDVAEQIDANGNGESGNNNNNNNNGNNTNNGTNNGNNNSNASSLRVTPHAPILLAHASMRAGNLGPAREAAREAVRAAQQSLTRTTGNHNGIIFF